MRERSPSKYNPSESSHHRGGEPDAYDHLYAAMQRPRQQRALRALSKITVRDLRLNFLPGKTESNSRD